MKLEYVPSFANFILVRVGDGQKVFNAMQKQGVIVRPMGGYQLPEWIRISVGTPAENERCLDALKKSLRRQRFIRCNSKIETAGAVTSCRYFSRNSAVVAVKLFVKPVISQC